MKFQCLLDFSIAPLQKEWPAKYCCRRRSLECQLANLRICCEAQVTWPSYGSRSMVPRPRRTTTCGGVLRPLCWNENIFQNAGIWLKRAKNLEYLSILGSPGECEFMSLRIEQWQQKVQLQAQWSFVFREPSQVPEFGAPGSRCGSKGLYLSKRITPNCFCLLEGNGQNSQTSSKLMNPMATSTSCAFANWKGILRADQKYGRLNAAGPQIGWRQLFQMTKTLIHAGSI